MAADPSPPRLEDAPAPLTSPPPVEWRRRGPWSKVAAVIALPLAFYLGVFFQYHWGPRLDNIIAPLVLAEPTSGLNTAVLDQEWQDIQHFYAHKNVDAQGAMDGAAKGLVSGVGSQFADDYSYYETPKELQNAKEFLAGSFGGIGAHMQLKDNLLTVTGVIHGTPAERAGLRENDVVVKVNGQLVAGMSVDAAVGLIRGQVGSHVVLAVKRGGQTLTFDVVREAIVVPSVYSIEVAKGVLYVRLMEFGEHTADDFDQALKDGLARGDKKIVLDLRKNPGGFVSAADSVTSEFVKSGLSVTLVDRNGHREEHTVSGKGQAFTQPLVVLVDGDSASAAEIVAGALKDNHRAYVIGQKSFGKGSVQEDFPLSNGGDLHLTVAYWYTPSGHSIQKTAGDPKSGGITPDRSVALATPESFYDISVPGADPRPDAQLQAALAYLR